MAQITGSTNDNQPAVIGQNTGSGDNSAAGVLGESAEREGVVGTTKSPTHAGVAGISDNPDGTGPGVYGEARNKGAGVTGIAKGGGVGVYGESKAVEGVVGTTKSPTHSGISGISDNPDGTGPGVYGEARNKGAGVTGIAKGSGAGVYGESKALEGVVGITQSPTHAGISGISDNPDGTGSGVYGEARNKGVGVTGIAKGSGAGVYGESKAVEGVVGTTKSPTHAAIAGIAENPSGTGAGLFGESRGKGPAIFGKGPFAGLFDGDIVVNGSISVRGDVTLTNADCAEQFDVDPAAEPTEAGMVLTLGAEGRVKPCTAAYDTRVAGVISGAGSYRPALILNKEAGQTSGVPVALVGRVCCLVDASYAPVAVGDLLTTSETPGHAMKASDRSRAFGAIVGKALAPLSEGCGLIPVLIAMQ